MAPITKLQLSLHAANLPRSGTVRHNPDTLAQVAIIPPQFATGEQPVQLGRTEVIQRSSNPRWAKVYTIEYEFGTQLSFFVDVLTCKGDDSKSIGGANFEVGDILGSKNKTKAKRLRKGGCVFAHIEQSTSEGSAGIIAFQLCALRLEFKGGLMRSVPSTFFEVARQTETSVGNNWNVIYRSNPVMESLKPIWDRAELDLDAFCNGDLDRPILISIFVFRKRGNHGLLGSFETTAKHLIEKAEKGSQREWHESTFVLRRGGDNDEESGCVAVMEGTIVLDGEGTACELPGRGEVAVEACAVISNGEQEQHDAESAAAETVNLASLQFGKSAIGTVLQLQSRPQPTFLAYVNAGLEIDLCVAIDFTSSNGDPRQPGTLHHSHDGALNDYEETILSVGGAIAKYSVDKEFNVWGFGAKYGGEVRHIFQCGPTSTATGVDGILDAYRSVFRTDLTMSGPTVIAKVIQAAAARASKIHRKVRAGCVMRYCTLLILTDGVLNQNNLWETRNLLARVSGTPLSVVIVGIGMADFSAMQDLMDASGDVTRDNVTFVAFRPHQHDPQSLSRAALGQVPDQIVQYFVKNGVYPEGNRSHGRQGSTADSVISELTADH